MSLRVGNTADISGSRNQPFWPMNFLLAENDTLLSATLLRVIFFNLRLLHADSGLYQCKTFSTHSQIFFRSSWLQFAITALRNFVFANLRTCRTS